eukprot:symbB.v1.2.008826.t1/scaffold533.1/size203693/5
MFYVRLLVLAGIKFEVLGETLGCEQLIDFDNHERLENFGEKREASKDIRDYLWPKPWDLELHDEMGRSASVSNLSILPLLADPCRLSFNITTFHQGKDLDDLRWTLHHWCWRLCSERFPESTCFESQRPRLEMVTLDVEGSAHQSALDLNMNESYLLHIGPNDTFLRASSIHGMKRGLETLLQVLDALKTPEAPADACAATPTLWRWAPGISDGKVWSLHINDHPRFPWRGLLLDTARHFIPTKMIKSVLLEMASNKLNVLHWHLTDAMSFPLELEALPNLAKLGAFTDNQTYSKATVEHLVAYAANLSIRIVPELDMPAHTASWIYGEPLAVSNCTHVKPEDPKEAKNYFKARDKLALDIASPRSRQVAKMILREIAELFPDEFLHVGGDEVDYRCWTTMPQIKKWMQKKGFGPLQALQDFFDDIFTEVKRLGKRPMIWEDAFDQGLTLPPGAVVQPWKCWGSVKLVEKHQAFQLPSMLGHAAAFMATQRKLSAVQSSCWYLDWPSQWMDFYEHGADEGPLSTYESSRLLGGEAALWTERIDFTLLRCRLWPRAAALAERLWSNTTRGFAAQKDRASEVDVRLAQHMERFQRHFRHHLRPLRLSNASDASQQALDTFHDIETTCPLLESQAIQRRSDEEPWASVLAESLQLPGEQKGCQPDLSRFHCWTN